MGSRDKQNSKAIWQSFSYALVGILTAVKQERNMQIHVASSVIVVCAAIYFSISAYEWMLVLFAIGGMFALEMVNTAIERVVDLATAEYHPLAKQAKDIAAGAVFVYACLAVIIGIIVFFPYLQKFFDPL